jgi:CHAD domain-containing protein
VTVHEREIKLAAPPAVTLPPLSDALAGVIAEPAGTRHLLATYYDTDDLRLARAGASLRHRNDEGWAVKLPVGARGDGLLDRATYSFAGNGDDPPSEALDLVRAYVRTASLAPVARLRTIRRATHLRTAQGNPIGEVTDDDVTVVSGDAPVRAFRELEFEIADGAPEAQTTAIVARLRAAGAGEPDPTPKIVRALGPRAAEPSDVEAGAGATQGVGAVVSSALRAAVAKLVTNDPGVRRGDDPEELHQARVATRRLRAHLGTFRRLLEEHWADALRADLQWLGTAFGAVRDADVLLDRLEGRLEQVPGRDRPDGKRIFELLRAQRERARDDLLVILRSDRYAELLERLVQAAREPRLAPRVDDEVDETDEVVLAAAVRRPWNHLRDAVESLPDDPADEQLHAVRKRAKRARYAAEAVESVFGKPARAFARALTEVQDVLGEHQDAVVAADWLRTAAAQVHDERAAFVAGELVALEHEAGLAARRAWPEVWADASNKKHRRWL